MQLFDCQLQPQMDKSQIMSSTDLEKQLQIVENNSKVFSSYDLTHGLEQSNNFAYQKKRA